MQSVNDAISGRLISKSDNPLYKLMDQNVVHILLLVETYSETPSQAFFELPVGMCQTSKKGLKTVFQNISKFYNKASKNQPNERYCLLRRLDLVLNDSWSIVLNYGDSLLPFSRNKSTRRRRRMTNKHYFHTDVDVILTSWWYSKFVESSYF